MCGKIKFHNNAPMLKYCQNLLNSRCFSSLASAFVSIKQTKAANDISLRIEKSLKSKEGNHIYFANAILKNEKKLQCKMKVYYRPSKYKNTSSYDIMTDISEHFYLSSVNGFFRKCESCHQCCWVLYIWLKLQKSICT